MDHECEMDHAYIEEHDLGARYVTGRLTGGEEQEFEAHLVDCPRCIDAAEPEMSLREGLRLVASESATQVGAHKTRPVSKIAPVLSWFQVAAAVLLVVSVGLGVWLSRSTAQLRSGRAERNELQRRAEQAEQSATALGRRLADVPARVNDAPAAPPAGPVLPAVVFALTTVRGSSAADAGPVNRIRIDGNARLVVFSLELPVVAASGDYAISLNDQAGRLLWSGGTFPPSSSDSLGVAVDPALLPGGDYVLELSHRSAAGGLTLVSRYPFRVAAR